LSGTDHNSAQNQATPQSDSHTNDPNQDTSGASMQPATPSQASPHHQGLSNAASINNIINSPANAQGEHRPSSQPAQNAPANAPANAQQKERTTKGKYSQEDFLLQRTLGTGSFGRVHLVQSKHNHRFYAMKVLKKAQVVKMKQIEHTNDERRMLNRVRHPFLVTLWGTWQDSRNLYMVMDFVEGGELFSLLRKSQVRALFSIAPPLSLPLPPLSCIPSPRAQTQSLISSLFLPVAFPQSSCQILCSRSHTGVGVSSLPSNYLS
jgi:protein kinase A